MNAIASFNDCSEFVARLRALESERSDSKVKARRKSLSPQDRHAIFAKTGGKCHICGGQIAENESWQADHVFSHSMGGAHSLDNYLPAHSLCNNYRWFYLSEEFQWILKLGVWLRTEIRKQSRIGRIAAIAFLAHERIRVARTKDAAQRAIT
jgi:5-methylcytosine-specific restriction endonuclease McrA